MDYDKQLRELRLSCTVYHLLARKQFNTVRDLEGWTGEKLTEKIDFFGPVRLKELQAALADIGLKLPFTVPVKNRLLPPPTRAYTKVHLTDAKVLPAGTEAVLNTGSLHTLECEMGKGEKVYSGKTYLGRVMGYVATEEPSWYFRSFNPYGLTLKEGEWVWLSWDSIIQNGYGWFRRI